MTKKLSVVLVVCVVAVLAFVFLVRRSPREEVTPDVPPVERRTERAVIIDLPIVEEVQEPVEPPSPEGIAARRSAFLEELEDLDISKPVRAVIGADGAAANRRERRDALQKLTRQLSPDDVAALRAFLHARFADQEELRLLSFNGIKNDALDVLLRQDELPEGLGGQLVEMYRDDQHDDVWRDYCVQYFAGYYERRWPSPGRRRGPAPLPKPGERQAVDPSPGTLENPERQDIEAAYWEAVSEKDKTIAGTALMAIERLSRVRSEFDRDKIGAAAVDLASDDQCLEGSRITALRVCGLMGRKEVLPAARIVSQTGETTMLRMAAIATLGDLGEEHDIDLVETMAASSEKRIATVAESALQRLKKRLEG